MASSFFMDGIMIICCPYCDYSRTIQENRIPPSAELATCPKCKNRFKFRTLSASKAQFEDLSSIKNASQQFFNKSNQANSTDAFDEVRELNSWQQNFRQNNTPADEAQKQNTSFEAPYAKSIDQTLYQSVLKAEENNIPSGGKIISISELHENKIYKKNDDTPDASEENLYNLKQYISNFEKNTAIEMEYLYKETDGPVKDLGKLDEHEDFSKFPCNNETEIPWENPSKHGWIKSFFRTVRQVMFNSYTFYKNIPQNGPVSHAFLFFMIQSYIAIICTIVWDYVSVNVLKQTEIITRQTEILSFLLLLAPIALGLLLLFTSGVLRIIVEIGGQKKAEFPATCKVVAYSTSPFILAIIPFIGPVAGTIWFLFSLIIGCRNCFNVSWTGSVFVAIPIMSILAFGFLFFFF